MGLPVSVQPVMMLSKLVLNALMKAAGFAVEHDAPADLARLDQCLALHAANDQIDQHALVGGIQIPVVRRHDLEVPLDLAGIDVQGEDAVGVEGIAGAPAG